MSLRLAIDGRAFASPAGGVRRYVTELCGALLRVAPGVEIVAAGAPLEVGLPDGVTRLQARPSPPTNLGWAASGLASTLNGVAFDVFHAPAYTAPLARVHPVVVTIHDVSYARRPDWYPGANGPLRRAFYRASARRADRIITDSSFSRSEIEQAYGIPRDRIDVIPLASSGAFTPGHEATRAPFVLHVGDLHRRRNVGLLVDVVAALRREDPRCRDLSLVLAGFDRGDLDALRRRAEAAGAAAALRHAGCPIDDELAWLYRKAAVFAYPSRYEGFGLPVVEAMACGCPVVATSAGAVPEVTGKAAVLLDPDDAAGWRREIARLVTDSAAAAAASRASVARAAEFSWEQTAAATLSVYRRVVEEGSRRRRN